ncbi:MAG: MBL fold metallo-hydrolase [Methanobacterium sp.]|nr:MBL fold metallo-hydrolase [Methanobacterium sp.]
MEIIHGIHELRGRMVNCYLVVNNDEIMLIDTGLPGNSSKIIKYVETILKQSPHDIKTIIITHNHFDHVGSLSKIKEITGAKVAIHSADADYIRGKEKHVGGAFMNVIIKLLKALYGTKPVEPEILLKDGDLIGGYQVIHTPGHSPGSICLYNPENKVIFVGDNLQYTKGKLQSPGERLILEPEKYDASMRKLLDIDFEIILTGHTAPVLSGGKELMKDFVKDLNIN